MLEFIRRIFSGAKKKRQQTKAGVYLPNVDGKVGRDMLEQALDFFISIEPDPALPNAVALYEHSRAKYKKEIERATQIIKCYAEQIEPKTLEHMQQKFYEITNSSKYQQSNVHVSVVYSILSSVWNGVGPWQA